MRSSLIGALLLGAAAPATAALVSTGTITGNVGDSVEVALPMYTDVGAYRAYLAFSRPGSFSAAYKVIRTTNLYCDFGDGAGFVPCGGDDVPIGFDLFAGPGATTATLDYRIAAPFREDYSSVQYGLVFDHADGALFDFTFETDGDISYRVVSAPVPEPATWAMMLGGFALAGGALRGRARKPALA
jgi:hypothetical protein